MKHAIATALLALCLLTACQDNSEHIQGSDPIQISNAYVRAPIASSTTATAYFKLHNKSQQPIELIAVQSTHAGAVEIHEHLNDEGTMRMRRMTALSIAPESSVEFQPGGKHLMLFRFDASNAKQDQLTFEFDSGQKIRVTADVTSLL